MHGKMVYNSCGTGKTWSFLKTWIEFQIRGKTWVPCFGKTWVSRFILYWYDHHLESGKILYPRGLSSLEPCYRTCTVQVRYKYRTTCMFIHSFFFSIFCLVQEQFPYGMPTRYPVLHCNLQEQLSVFSF